MWAVRTDCLCSFCPKSRIRRTGKITEGVTTSTHPRTPDRNKTLKRQAERLRDTTTAPSGHPGSNVFYPHPHPIPPPPASFPPRNGAAEATTLAIGSSGVVQDPMKGGSSQNLSVPLTVELTGNSLLKGKGSNARSF